MVASYGGYIRGGVYLSRHECHPCCGTSPHVTKSLILDRTGSHCRRAGRRQPSRLRRTRRRRSHITRVLQIRYRPCQMCLRQILHGRISPGKTSPKARQILRGEADPTWALSADSSSDNSALHNRCCFQCFPSGRYQWHIQCLGPVLMWGVLVHSNKHRE